MVRHLTASGTAARASCLASQHLCMAFLISTLCDKALQLCLSPRATGGRTTSLLPFLVCPRVFPLLVSLTVDTLHPPIGWRDSEQLESPCICLFSGRDGFWVWHGIRLARTGFLLYYLLASTCPSIASLCDSSPEQNLFRQSPELSSCESMTVHRTPGKQGCNRVL